LLSEIVIPPLIPFRRPNCPISQKNRLPKLYLSEDDINTIMEDNDVFYLEHNTDNSPDIVRTHLTKTYYKPQFKIYDLKGNESIEEGEKSEQFVDMFQHFIELMNNKEKSDKEKKSILKRAKLMDDIVNF